MDRWREGSVDRWIDGPGGSAGNARRGGGTSAVAAGGNRADRRHGRTQGGEAFPRTAVLDDFNRAEGTRKQLARQHFELRDQGRPTFVRVELLRCHSVAERSARAGSVCHTGGFDSNANEIQYRLKAQELSDCELLEVMYTLADRRIDWYSAGWLGHTIKVIALTLQSGDQLGARFYANACTCS